MKVVIEYEVDNTDGYYNVPAEIAAELIIEAETNKVPIHGFKNVKISILADGLDIAEQFIDSLQQEQESVAERFAKIVRVDLNGIDKEV